VSIVSQSVLALLLLGPAAAHAAEPELPILLKEDFEQGMARWQPTDDPANSVWKVVEQAGRAGVPPFGTRVNHVLRVTGQSKYQPPHRSPHSIVWLKDIVVKDFELTARVQNTRPDAGPHRDLCLFWGYQDPARYYYVHLGARPDPAACQIFIVNDAPRAPITTNEPKGTPWTNGWHTVKVVRRVADGTMEVYFDDMEKPVMTAKDSKFGAGRIGLGTFDDHGNFDDVVLRGERQMTNGK
jgi:hypothetical protein